jgi:hypothetical protein
MYEIGRHDKVVLLDEFPQPDVGAPIPVLVADESRIELAFIARPAEPSDGEFIASRGSSVRTRTCSGRPTTRRSRGIRSPVAG